MQRWTYRYAHIHIQVEVRSQYFLLSLPILFVFLFCMCTWYCVKTWRGQLKSLFSTSTLTRFVINPSQQIGKQVPFAFWAILTVLILVFFEIEFESLAEPRACQFSRTNWPGSAYVRLPCTGITGVHSCSELFKWVLGVWTQILTALGTKSDGAHLSKPSALISVWCFTWKKKYLIFRAVWVTSHPLTYYW